MSLGRPLVKCCGLTRPNDAAHAAALGVAYGGVIFAPSPRRLTLDQARLVIEALGPSVKPIGVFLNPSADEVEHLVRALALHAVQIHGALPPELARAHLGCELWRVVGVEGSVPECEVEAIAQSSAVTLFDTRLGGQTGGTGRTFDWVSARPVVDRARAFARVAVAGGLRPESVAECVRALQPDVVDVSSGIESSPGVKDHHRMADFVQAVLHA